MNFNKNKRFIAMALAFVMVMAFVQLPLAAKERRGSIVVVTMADGSTIKGELLAVKTDALLVFDRAAGQGKSIELQQIAQVKILMKSKIFQGFVNGLVVGGMMSMIFPHEHYAEMGHLVIPLQIGCLCGILGLFDSISKTITLPEASSPIMLEKLKQLGRYAREQNLEKPAETN